jgi:hypothetical protein
MIRIKITINVEGDLLLVFRPEDEQQFITLEMANPNCFHEAAEKIKEYVTNECERITRDAIRCIEHQKLIRNKACNVLDSFKHFGIRK